MQLAKQLGDLALEAQACYSLGNTYTLLRDYSQSIEYHTRHLAIAEQLQDKLGQVILSVIYYNACSKIRSTRQPDRQSCAVLAASPVRKTEIFFFGGVS